MFNFLFKFLYSLLSFALALFFIVLGLIAVILPLSFEVRIAFIEFITHNYLAISIFGYGFFVIGVAMLVNLYFATKRHYYYVKVKPHLVAVDEAVIHHYLQDYWKQLFPHQEIPTRLLLKRNKIKVIADLPYTPAEEQMACIEQIKLDLHHIFSQLLGYSQEFMLSISFKRKPS